MGRDARVATVFGTVSEDGAELWVYRREGAVSKNGVRQGSAPSDVIIPAM